MDSAAELGDSPIATATAAAVAALLAAAEVMLFRRVTR